MSLSDEEICSCIDCDGCYPKDKVKVAVKELIDFLPASQLINSNAIIFWINHVFGKKLI